MLEIQVFSKAYGAGYLGINRGKNVLIDTIRMDRDYTNINELPSDPSVSSHMLGRQSGAPTQMPTENMPLPSRDMPMNPGRYQHDEQLQPNYIPPVPPMMDYVHSADRRVENIHRNPKPKEKMLDVILEEMQMPVILAILFFIFQSPWISQLVCKWFSGFGVQADDMTFTTNGKVILSLLYGFSFYGLQKGLDYLKTI